MDGASHVQGSLPLEVARRREAKKTGVDPNFFEFWQTMHTRKKPHPTTGSMWVNKGSELRSTKFVQKFKENEVAEERRRREDMETLVSQQQQQALIQQQQMMEVMRIQMQSLMPTGGTGPHPLTFPWSSVGGSNHAAQGELEITPMPHTSGQQSMNIGNQRALFQDAPKKLGPSGYGGIQGTAKDINSNSVPKNLKSVSIWSKGGNTCRINAISFTYYDKDNIEVNEGPWGTTDGTPNVISIGHDEYLTKLCVTTANNCVTSLTFNTSKPAVHGPMGKEPTTGDKAFTIDVDPDSIVAFFGRADHYLRAIGAYSAPQA
ncbi:hypothetical protein QYE76_036930 [Lolium multiflorum]|uniref:Jacalin-type lectin domain-containing protein n=1 Tax=Lolium multiflorum TaxID=4521 RepID=A0AAD8R3S9_LOLMU|nr:hypothetical protein QYE76_036930 [Lolium multiflorum]